MNINDQKFPKGKKGISRVVFTHLESLLCYKSSENKKKIKNKNTTTKMPFVKRVVAPKYVCRKKQNPAPGCPPGESLAIALPLQDYELETITNVTLSNALRQLASLLLISNEIFAELNKELEAITERSVGVKQRIDALALKVDGFDPKLVPVRKYTFDY